MMERAPLTTACPQGSRLKRYASGVRVFTIGLTLRACDAQDIDLKNDISLVSRRNLSLADVWEAALGYQNAPGR